MSGVVVPTSGKKVSKVAYALLAFFLGVFGIHKFYAGHVLAGIIYLVLTLFVVTSFISGILSLVDFIVGLCNDSDENGLIEV